MAAALAVADAAITLTGYEKERLVQSYGMASAKIFVASVGIDTEPAPPERSDSGPLITYLGRQVNSKGIGDLIDAMTLVWSKHPDAELAIAGARAPESAEVDAKIAALPQEWRMRIRQLGRVSDDEKQALLFSSRCLVLPSKTESFGIVILEAWAQALPVITWDLPVFRSIVVPEKNGLLVDPSSGPAGLAEAITFLIREPDSAQRMGLAGYHTAAAFYSWEKMASVYEAAYEYAAGAR